MVALTVYFLLFGVWCLVFGVCCLLFVVCCLVFGVCCFLFGDDCLLPTAYFFLVGGSAFRFACYGLFSNTAFKKSAASFL